MDYLDGEGDKKMLDASASPFYLYLGVPSMHSPFLELSQFEAQCAALVEYDSGDALYQLARNKYCAMLLATDELVGVVMDSLRANELWSNTLMFVSSVNGGEIERGANNYP